MRKNPIGTSSARWPALAVALVLSACGSNEQQPAEVVIRGTDPNAGAQRAGDNTLNNSVLTPADGAGIVTYDGYQTAVARGGDTVSSVADRIGMSASELGAYNGLQPSSALREGDELVLPPRPGGYGGGTAATAQPGAQTSTTDGTIQATPLDSASPTTGPSSAAPSTEGTPQVASSSGWSPDLAAAAIERSVGLQDDGTLGAPPSSTEPVPPTPSERRELKSPDLGQYQTGASSTTAAANPPPPPKPAAEVPAEVAAAPVQSEVEQPTSPAPAQSAPVGKLRKPVDGPVAIGFNKGAGGTRNDGVDFAVPAGTPVVAAADGEVALVSESLGGLGTIVLLRHRDDLLTVYGRIDGVTVKKGQYVSVGQQIGVVSDARAPAEPRMHFEVRRGAESLDPMQFL